MGSSTRPALRFAHLLFWLELTCHQRFASPSHRLVNADPCSRYIIPKSLRNLCSCILPLVFRCKREIQHDTTTPVLRSDLCLTTPSTQHPLCYTLMSFLKSHQSSDFLSATLYTIPHHSSSPTTSYHEAHQRPHRYHHARSSRACET
jgi:hypothetical protein